MTNHPHIAVNAIRRTINAYLEEGEALSQEQESGIISRSAYLNKVSKLESQTIISISLLVSGKKDMDLIPKIKKDHGQQTVAHSVSAGIKAN